MSDNQKPRKRTQFAEPEKAARKKQVERDSSSGGSPRTPTEGETHVRSPKHAQAFIVTRLPSHRIGSEQILRSHAAPTSAAASQPASKESSSGALSPVEPGSRRMSEVMVEAAERLCVEEDEMADGNGKKKKRYISPEIMADKSKQAQKAKETRKRRESTLKSVSIPMAEKKAVSERFREDEEDTEDAQAVISETLTDKINAFFDVWEHYKFWSSHFKEIEGRFGSATASYFRFVRWLLFLNFFNCILILFVVIIPSNIYNPINYTDNYYHHVTTQPPVLLNTTLATNASSTESLPDNSTEITNLSASATPASPQKGSPNYTQQATLCSLTYDEAPESMSEAGYILYDKIQDFVLGTGWMEKTMLFYGTYHNVTTGSGQVYNMGLAYLVGFAVSYIVIFICILVNSSHSVKELVMDDEDQSLVYYTNNVLCGWDFSIFDEKSARNRQNILFQEFKADLLEQSKRLSQQRRTQAQQFALVVIRVLANILAVAIQISALFLIYFATSSLVELRLKATTRAELLIVQFLPSLTITSLNAAVPSVFKLLASLEDYRPALELKITIIRLVCLRLSSLGVLVFTLYYSLLWPNHRNTFHCPEEESTGTSCCGNYLWPGSKSNISHVHIKSSSVMCWETFVGQQFYKLGLVDCMAMVAITFIVEFPRRFIVDNFREKSHLLDRIGRQEFNLPRSVLDIIYTQTLGWLGTFFSPLLPVMTFIKVLLVFYVKKYSLLMNFAPAQHVYKLSKSNSFFNLILLLSFLLVSCIIGYMVTRINPSKSCGPYRVYSEENYVIWNSLKNEISSWPPMISETVFFFGTNTFFVPCAIFLCLVMYYYWAVAYGYQRNEEILREQLRLEDRDRQFLLARVNDLIQQGLISGDKGGMGTAV